MEWWFSEHQDAQHALDEGVVLSLISMPRVLSSCLAFRSPLAGMARSSVGRLDGVSLLVFFGRDGAEVSLQL